MQWGARRLGRQGLSRPPGHRGAGSRADHDRAPVPYLWLCLRARHDRTVPRQRASARQLRAESPGDRGLPARAPAHPQPPGVRGDGRLVRPADIDRVRRLDLRQGGPAPRRLHRRPRDAAEEPARPARRRDHGPHRHEELLDARSSRRACTP
jgi:hypothetical protein